MKLETPIDIAQTEVFKGEVDLYYWKGIPCARKWPKTPVQPNSPAQRATYRAFADMMAWKKRCPLSWQRQWEATATPVGVSKEDAIRKQGLLLAYQGALVAPPDITKVEHRWLPTFDRTTISVYVKNYTGFDRTKIKIRWKTRTPNEPNLGWNKIVTGGNANCELKPTWRPQWEVFNVPYSETWSAGTSRWIITVRYQAEGWQIVPVPAKVTNPLIACAPPYDSVIF